MSRPSLYAVVGQSEKRDVLEKGQLIQPCILEAMNYYQTKKSSPAHLEGGAEPAGVKLKQKKC